MSPAMCCPSTAVCACKIFECIANVPAFPVWQSQEKGFIMEKKFVNIGAETLLPYENCGHSPMVDCPDRLTADVCALFKA